MSLLDDLKSKIFKGPEGPPPGTPAVRPMAPPPFGPPDLSRGIPSVGVSPPPGISAPFPTPSAEPTLTPFSPGAEISSFMPTQPQVQEFRTEVASSKDIVRLVERLEDRVDLMNEKIDLILRELRNIYSIMRK